MHIIDIAIRNKIAVNTNQKEYICGNDDFVVMFDFDAEWDAFVHKTARFISNGAFVDVVFSGNECAMPVHSGTNTILCGVYAGDLRTTTPALIGARKSILCGSPPPAEPHPDVYAQMVVLFNSGLDEGRVNANRAEDAKTAAEEAQRKAESAQSTSETIAKAVNQAKTDAQAAQKAAEDAKTGAELAKQGISDALTQANQFKQDAQNAQTAAEQSAKNADSSKQAAKKSETAAKQSEENAALSEKNAKTSEGNAKQSETNAKVSESNAQKAAEAVAQSAKSIGQAEQNAKKSEVNAAAFAEEARKQALGPVKSVNDVWPDENGNVKVEWASMTGSDTLTWDCDTEGRISVTTELGVYYKVSDIVPTEEESADGMEIRVYGKGVIDIIDPDHVLSYFLSDGAALMGEVCIIPYNNYEYLGAIFPEAGIYFVRRDGNVRVTFKINGYAGFPLKLNKASLPDDCLYLLSPSKYLFKITVSDSGVLTATKI